MASSNARCTISQTSKGSEKLMGNLVARWEIRFNLKLTSAAHFGTGEGGVVDMEVLRDEDGNPLLAGSSLAGALRSHLVDRLMGYREKETEKEKVGGSGILFGGVKGDDEGAQSPLIVHEVKGLLPKGGGVEIRDGVGIDVKSGTALKGAKFDYEVIPAGTVFGCRLELLVFDASQESSLLQHLLASLAGLENGEIALGAKTTRGFGACEAVDWEARRWNLKDEPGWASWLAYDHCGDLAGEKDRKIKTLLTKLAVDSVEAFEDNRDSFLFDVKLLFPHGLMVGAPAEGNESMGDVDTGHLHSGGKPIISGTSLAGVLRARANRYAHPSHPDKVADTINALFGHVEGEASSSRIIISASTIKDGKTQQMTRVTIDRFTGGAMDHRLFSELPIYGGKARFQIELRNPLQNEVELVLLCLRDLITGWLPVGGTSSVGRGFAYGSVKVIKNGEEIGSMNAKGYGQEGYSDWTPLALDATDGLKKLEKWIQVKKEGEGT